MKLLEVTSSLRDGALLHRCLATPRSIDLSRGSFQRGIFFNLRMTGSGTKAFLHKWKSGKDISKKNIWTESPTKRFTLRRSGGDTTLWCCGRDSTNSSRPERSQTMIMPWWCFASKENISFQQGLYLFFFIFQYLASRGHNVKMAAVESLLA